MKQIYNPYLPSFEYVPDGEPHVFGDRLYLYGSHDRFDSAGFCLNDYVCYSAPVTDLTDWKYEGVIYRKNQDPRNQNIPEDAPEQTLLFGIEPKRPEDLNPKGVHAMWAPDVVCGPDKRYYLYYCLDFLSEIGVAVSDTPNGPFAYHGLVQHKDGTPLGKKDGDKCQFDPGIFVDDDGEIYLYSGNAPMSLDYEADNLCSQVMTLENNMLTLKTEPRKLLPDLRDETEDFKGHEFFEASSIRKIGSKYYFVYSSVRSHELCYCISDRPDSGYQFGGTLVDIGDIFLNGRTEQEGLNALGNTHGGIECANGQWYVFYHRQTNRTNYSRQGCAEKIFFTEDGRIPQVEVTSQGMNPGALCGKGGYPASIACCLLGKDGVKFSHPMAMKMDYPFFCQDGLDIEPTKERIASDQEHPHQFIRNVLDGSVMGYKYFSFEDSALSSLCIRGKAKGTLTVFVSPKETPVPDLPSDDLPLINAPLYKVGEVEVTADSEEWQELSTFLPLPDGTYALYFRFQGEGSFDFREFKL
ncbi:MAG: family 43 glycosylhydrolase [Eubacteriales bacterium]|nr:family 43 glycosylhydrolase [Eubacteriales bacterium]